MDDLAYTVLTGLAVARVWRLLAVDGILDPVRVRLPDPIQRFLGCPWCAGFWILVVWVIVWPPLPVATLLAASQIVGMVGDRGEA